MALTTHPHLLSRIRKEYHYISAPPQPFVASIYFADFFFNMLDLYKVADARMKISIGASAHLQPIHADNHESV